MQSHLLRSFNVNVTGKGTQPIVFAHGLGCDQTMWRLVTPAFEDRYKVILFDYIGSGKSDSSLYDNKKYNTLQGYAQDVIALCQSLLLRDVIFVGHSVSCMIGLLAAIASPDLFSRLVMVAPSPCYLNDGAYRGGFEKHELDQLLAYMEKNLEAWANLYTPQIMANTDRPELAGELYEQFCSTDPSITQQFATITFRTDSRGDLGKLTVPTLILQCSDDILAPPEVGAYLEKHIRGSKLHKMQATGHCPHLSAPDETVAAINRYLSGS